MKNVGLFLVLLSGWAAFAYQHHLFYKRRDEVRMWAEEAYHCGYDDRGWANYGYGPFINKEFCVSDVMEAFDGAWDGAK
jgi:hypothetical protein